ncbi:unnamed protein product [Pleuronectes platessa]|uniref:Uncharacterized protein n=1 Tax=Pleuronectes platessa TaxID=8262 RepID=A0A9N7Z695_PLEPL|nr:unnamed protein product [Pleuronectes platessa]
MGCEERGGCLSETPPVTEDHTTGASVSQRPMGALPSTVGVCPRTGAVTRGMEVSLPPGASRRRRAAVEPGIANQDAAEGAHAGVGDGCWELWWWPPGCQRERDRPGRLQTPRKGSGSRGWFPTRERRR